MRTLTLYATDMGMPIYSTGSTLGTLVGADILSEYYTFDDGGGGGGYSPYPGSMNSERFYIAFEPLPKGLENTIPETVRVYLYCHDQSNTAAAVGPEYFEYVGTTVWSLAKRFTEDDLVNLNIPSYYNDRSGVIKATRTQGYRYVDLPGSSIFLNIPKYGIRGVAVRKDSAGNQYDSGYFRTWTKQSQYPPYIVVTYDEGNLVAIIDSPTGYIDRTKPNTFRWGLTYEGFPIEAVTQKSATLYWRNGTGGTINSIQITGSATEYTLPANTLPASANLQWRVQATSTTNVTTTNTVWQNITTIDAEPVAVAVSPAGTYVDGSKDIRFAWRHEVSTGSPQTRYDLQYKTNVSDWVSLKTEYTANTYADVPGSNLPSGTIQWRVRTYNGDGLASVWSNILTAVVIASPEAPALNVNVISPRPEISWQSNDQQAYQVQMGSYDSGQAFGVDKAFKCPVHLPDGSVTVRVRVLNEYNLWSPWAERVISIVNAPGLSVTLTAAADHDTHLSWATEDTVVLYWVYRDGILIAKTSDTGYTDKLAIGTHHYVVRAELPDSDNYTDSNEVSTTARTEFPIICELDGEWISLQLSANSNPTIQITTQKEVSLLQLSGAIYPVPETAAFMRRSYTVRAAFLNQAAASRLESLLGKLVCVKDQYENLVVGITATMNKIITPFYVEITATVDEVDSGEYNAVDIL